MVGGEKSEFPRAENVESEGEDEDEEEDGSPEDMGIFTNNINFL